MKKSYQSTIETLAFPCEKCEKSFDTIQGLGLHRIRAHTRKGKHYGFMGRTAAAKKAKKQRRAKNAIPEQTSDNGNRRTTLIDNAYDNGNEKRKPMISPNFCPDCGFNVRAHSPDSTAKFCQECGFHLNIISATITALSR